MTDIKPSLSVAIDVPGHNGVFSFSQLNEWDRCRFQWHLSYREGWTPSVKAKALNRGTMWHAVMQLHYTEASPHFEVQKYLREQLEDSVTGETIQLVDQITWLYEMYCEWAPYQDARTKTLAVEKHFEIPMVTPKGRDFIFQGYVDRIFEEGGKTWVQDHKSYSATPITPIEALMDPQMPAYCLALMHLGYHPFGIEFNQANFYPYKKRHEKTPDQLFVRERTFRSVSELEAYTQQVGASVDDIIDNYDYPRRSLMRDCKFCKFQDPCLLALKGIPLADAFAMNDSYRKKESYV